MNASVVPDDRDVIEREAIREPARRRHDCEGDDRGEPPCS
jgi:hypothetical protein